MVDVPDVVEAAELLHDDARDIAVVEAADERRVDSWSVARIEGDDELAEEERLVPSEDGQKKLVGTRDAQHVGVVH